MKIKTDQNTENFGHKKFRFKIDEKHAMKAIWALINLYQYKIATPVQEIICNARDAHREVGKPDHTIDIKVTNTEFIVRDYGSGIDPDKAENIFCSIGETTKGGDNKQTGGHGVGAKSPLAYTKQFELTSYVDGKKYHYIIAKNGEMLDMNLVSTSDTNIENGTKVVIPIGKNRSFHESEKDRFIYAVRKCCFFWDKRPSFNHDIPDCETFRLKGLNNYGYYKTNSMFSGDYIVLDGIPYKAANHSRNNRVLFFNTGDLRTHETRERLADNNDDKTYNEKKIQKAFLEMNDHISTKIGSYVDQDAIMESFKELNNFKVPFKFTHNNVVFTTSNIYINDSVDVYKSIQGSRYRSSFKYKKDKFKYLSYDTEIFYNENEDSPQKVSRRVKAYLQKYVDSNEYHAVHVTNDKNVANLLNAKKLSTLSLPKINRSGVKKKKDDQITITLLTRYGQDRIYKYMKDIKRKYMYISFSEDISNEVRVFLEKKGYLVCRLSKDNIENVKDSIHFTDLLEYIENYKISNNEINYIYRSKLKKPHLRINLKKVLDSEISKILEICNLYEKETNEVDYLVPKSLYTKEVNDTLLKLDAHNFELSQIKDYVYVKYPLLSSNTEINTEYVNALYEYRK